MEAFTKGKRSLPEALTEPHTTTHTPEKKSHLFSEDTRKCTFKSNKPKEEVAKEVSDKRYFFLPSYKEGSKMKAECFSSHTNHSNATEEKKKKKSCTEE